MQIFMFGDSHCLGSMGYGGRVGYSRSAGVKREPLVRESLLREEISCCIIPFALKTKGSFLFTLL